MPHRSPDLAYQFVRTTFLIAIPFAAELLTSRREGRDIPVVAQTTSGHGRVSRETVIAVPWRRSGAESDLPGRGARRNVCAETAPFARRFTAAEITIARRRR